LNRKSVHINLNEGVHTEFRIIAFQNKLSMQEIISSLVTKLVDKDPYLESLIEELKKNKKSKELQSLTNVESFDVFDEINKQSPFDKK
tara:strand:+ start:4318 stop:4581 length:264 start_codon:yes stop_codon:yes gene_type:complete